MSENEMNEQPAGEQPATTGDTTPQHGSEVPGTPEPQGWRPPPAPPSSSPWAPAPFASEPAATTPASTPATSPVGSEPTVAGPVASGPVASGPTETGPVGSQPAEPTTVDTPTGPESPAFPTAQYPAAPNSEYSTGSNPEYPAGSSPQYPGNQNPQYPAQSPYALPAEPTGDPAYASGSAYVGEGPAAAYPSAGYPTSSYPATGTHEARRGRGVGTIALFTLLGLVLAAGGGVAGAATMHHFDKSNTVTVNSAGQVVDNAPIVDRSSLASIASAVSPSVVSINTQEAEGSGVILSTDGYILTNNHVAATASGQSVDITFSNGSSTTATLVGTDAKTDLAVYKAQNVSNLVAAKFGDSGALQVGDTVLAIGSPLGLDGSVTAGIVSALNRTIDESSDTTPDPNSQSQPQSNSTTTAPTIAGAIQTDASINPGNSGGALVNTSGQVVGINTAIATNGADGSIGVGFSIPSNRAKQVANDIIKGVPVSHPQLGVSVSTATNNGGAQIAAVTSGSAAAAAGLKAGDVITEFNGQPVHTSDDLLDDVQAGTVGTSYALTVVRSGQSMTINVTLKESN
jgi:putative serine protease PepD